MKDFFKFSVKPEKLDKPVFVGQPAKEETLLVIQQEKIKRLNNQNGHPPRVLPQWWLSLGEFSSLILLFLLNLYLLFPFFGKENQANGFSAPLIPTLAQLTIKFMPYSFGIRFWLLSFMLFFPISFYLMAKEITHRKLVGFIGALVASLPVKYLLSSRVSLGLLGDDGAHIASLTLTLLVCVFLLKFLREGNFNLGILSALTIALVALTSVLGLIVMVVFASFTTFSEMLVGHGRVKAARFLSVLIIAFGFAAFWYNPAFIALLVMKSPQGILLRQIFTNLFPISFFLAPILGVFGFLIFESRAYLQPLFLAIFLTISFTLAALGSGFSQPSPSRFSAGLGVSLALLLGIVVEEIVNFFLLSPLLDKFKLTPSKRRTIIFIFLGVILGVLIGVILYFGPGLYNIEKISETESLLIAKKVGIWEIREKSFLFKEIIGYPITILTVFIVFLLKLKSTPRLSNGKHWGMLL